MGLVELVILAAVQSSAAAAVNPLAPALAGKLECTYPDHQKKTCRSLASYTLISGSRYRNTSVILVSPNGPVTLESTQETVLKGDAVCGTIRADDITAGKLRVGEAVLDPEKSQPALERLVTAMAPVMNKEVCVTYERAGDGLVEKGSVDGVSQPSVSSPLEWVLPGDGYRVAP